MESDLVVGSGRNMHKTTIIHLLPRFYQLDSGRILIDGHDIADVTVKSLRRQIGIVLQQTFLFDRSIRENIAFGKPGATLPEAKEAARAAEMREFIEPLPEGYDTLVGQRGAILSRGQRQRIAIARMLLTDPRMVVLDESTAVPPRGLEEQETRAYTEHVLKQAGASRPLFSDPAIAQVHATCRGIPRVINNLCTACLLDVMAHDGQEVDIANVQRVQLDFEQL